MIVPSSASAVVHAALDSTNIVQSERTGKGLKKSWKRREETMKILSHSQFTHKPHSDEFVVDSAILPIFITFSWILYDFFSPF
jgi:hypothetical protein